MEWNINIKWEYFNWYLGPRIIGIIELSIDDFGPKLNLFMTDDFWCTYQSHLFKKLSETLYT